MQRQMSAGGCDLIFLQVRDQLSVFLKVVPHGLG